MLIFKVAKHYFENPKLFKKWQYFKNGNLTSIRLSAEPLELSQNMWGSMTILAFHEAFSFYSDTTMPFNQGFLRNFSEFYDMQNFWVPKETIMQTL